VTDYEFRRRTQGITWVDLAEVPNLWQLLELANSLRPSEQALLNACLLLAKYARSLSAGMPIVPPGISPERANAEPGPLPRAQFGDDMLDERQGRLCSIDAVAGSCLGLVAAGQYDDASSRLGELIVELDVMQSIPRT